MKRNWIWGLCATTIAGGALAIAQQEGSGLPSAGGPLPAANSPVQEIAPTGVASTSAGSATNAAGPIQELAPSGIVSSAPAGAATTATSRGVATSSNDPFSGQTQVRGSAASADPFGRAPGTVDAAPAQASRNSGGGRATAGGFGQMGGLSGSSGGFPNQNGRFGGGWAGNGAAWGQNISNMSISKEAREFRDAEAAVQQTADRLRHTSKDDPAADKLKQDLKAAVTKSFEARQAQQAAEVKRLKEKLAEIEATVTRREKIKEDLILERMSELTSGGGEAFGGVGPSNVSGFGVFPTIPSSNVPVELPTTSSAPLNTTIPAATPATP